MKAKNLRWVTILLVGVLPGFLAARAQEDVVAVEPEVESEVEPVAEDRERAPAERPETRFLLEIGYLGATTVGGDHRIGTEYTPETGVYRTLYMPEEMGSGTLYRVAWKLPEDWGEIVGRYWSHEVATGTVASRPGDFVFGITETIPFAHGVADDGLADAVEASASFKNRDGDVSWRFRLVEKPRLQLDAAVGIRKVIHREDSSVAYFALDAGLPSLIEPGGGDQGSLLAPVPDRASSLSDFEGNGIQFGVDALVPLVSDRLQLEASATIALLRGTTRASYSTNTSLYLYRDVPISFDEFLERLEAEEYGLLSQLTLQLGIEDPGRSTTASALDLSVGLRSRIWRGIEVALGAKLTRYEDIAYDLRPTAPSLSPAGLFTFGGIEESWRSIGYEAFYASAAYRF
jgi:hypothetical protein